MRPIMGSCVTIDSIVAEIRKTQLSIETVVRKDLLLKIHLGAQLDVLRARDSKRFAVNFLLFCLYIALLIKLILVSIILILLLILKHIAQLELGMSASTAYRYIAVSKLVSKLF